MVCSFLKLFFCQISDYIFSAPFEGDDYFDQNGGFPPEERNDSDQESLDGQWHQPVKFVYDAAAERTQERIREGHALVVNGVH